MNDRPERRLGSRPRCKSIADVELALREIAWITARKDLLTAKCNQKIAELTARLENDLQVDGASIDERKDLLEVAIETYAEGHRDDFVSRDSKTRKLAGGTVSFRLSVPKVSLGPGETSQSALQSVGWSPGAADDLIEELGLAGWVRVQAEIDFSALKKAVLAGEITAEELGSYGLVWQPATEAVQVTSDPTVLRAE